MISEEKDKLNSDFFKTNKKKSEFRWTIHELKDGYPGLHITIPVPKEKLNLIFKIEKLLSELGLSFDSGYGEGCRDWEFDWSLKGKHFIYDEEKKKYIEIKR